jgi:hypothetical protein
MQNDDKIREEFKENFPIEGQVIKSGFESWDFTDYFNEKLDELIHQAQAERTKDILSMIQPVCEGNEPSTIGYFFSVKDYEALKSSIEERYLKAE